MGAKHILDVAQQPKPNPWDANQFKIIKTVTLLEVYNSQPVPKLRNAIAKMMVAT